MVFVFLQVGELLEYSHCFSPGRRTTRVMVVVILQVKELLEHGYCSTPVKRTITIWFI